jgi:hypothetical protein
MPKKAGELAASYFMEHPICAISYHILVGL